MITAFALINSFIPALTVTERWQAARHLKSSSTFDHWFAAILVFLIAMPILFLVVSHYKKVKRQKSAP